MNFDISSLVAGLDFNTNHFVDAGNGLMLTNNDPYKIKIANGRFTIFVGKYTVADSF